MKIGDYYINPEVPPAEREEYVQSAESWITAAADLAKETKHTYARRLVGRLLVNTAVCKPDIDGVIPIQGPEEPALFIIPVMKKDGGLTQNTRDLVVNKTKPASFAENNPGRLYYDATSPMTDTWKGLVLYHELAHADNHVNQRYALDQSEHWLEEADVFDFEIELLQEIGGKGYSKLRQKLLPGFTEEFTNNGQFPPVDIDNDIDDVFGAPLSESERTTRGSVVYLDIAFTVLNNVLGDEARQMKAQILEPKADT